MKTRVLGITLIMALTGVAHAAAPKNVDKKAHDIISKKCTSCHGEAQINAAFKAGKDMRAIQKDMQQRGAKLSASDQEVLGIFWKQKSPVK